MRKTVKIGEICIDTGKVWIGDPSYSKDEQEAKRFGVTSSTGFGDGTYPVYAVMDDVIGLDMNNPEIVVSITIDFMGARYTL
jgi:hypothetical protein